MGHDNPVALFSILSACYYVEFDQDHSNITADMRAFVRFLTFFTTLIVRLRLQERFSTGPDYGLLGGRK